MIEDTLNEKTDLIEKVFSEMQKNSSFEISPCDKMVDLENKSRFTKLELNSAQKMHVSGLLQQVPSLMSVSTMAQTYRVQFPAGMPHTLMQLKEGGVGSPIIGKDGKIIEWASFYKNSSQAAALGVFTAMSIASGQYFLSHINSELKMIKLNLDKILEFLYGDKKAELMAEVSFVKYVYQNYSSIMEHNDQRVATITSIQETRKVAMKDVEFYMGDLDSAVTSKDYSDIDSLVNKPFQIKENLDLSMQLYVMSSLLEVYYSQNYDTSYIQYLESEVVSYIDKCEKRMLSNFSVLSMRISDYKAKILEKVDRSPYEKKVGELVELLKNSGEKSEIRKTLHSVLHASTDKSEYYVNADGNAYLKL